MSKSFIRSSSIVSAMTFVSRILGLIRDFVIARLFGANELTDAFLVAFRIPNFFRRLFAEGAFSQAFLPILAAGCTAACWKLGVVLFFIQIL